MPVVIGFEHVSKRYQIGSGARSLRDLIAGLGRRRKAADAEEFWALRNVSFEVEHGRVLGIIGHNGAGKTTALKLLSGITQPTEGKVHVDGRISALIELGAGFHPDLSGRENVYLNATILGLTTKQIDQRFKSIVEFAELERFIDTPVKRYSSGMYARLGFAVAAHSDPDLLLVDEVLGVGDANFQRKCFDFIQQYVRGDKSAIFVSHNLFVVEQLCDELLWLNAGEVMMIGKPGEVLPRYYDHLEQSALATQAETEAMDVHSQLRLDRAVFVDADGKSRDTFTTGEDMTVEIPYAVGNGAIAAPHFCLGVLPSGGGQSLFAANMFVDGAAPPALDNSGAVRCRFQRIPLMPRTYELWGEVWAEDRVTLLAPWQRFGSFRVVASADIGGDAAQTSGVTRVRAAAPIRVPYQWEFVDERVAGPAALPERTAALV